MMKFANGVRIIKDNLFSTPPLFRLIQGESGTDWREMYEVFNMGNRMEIYTDEKSARKIIDIASGFNIEAQIIGRVERSAKKQLVIKGEHGEFTY